VRLSANDQERDSIESRIESQAYHSFEGLVHDVNLVSSSILEGLKDVAESKARSQILVFKQLLDRLLRKEVLRGSVVKNEDNQDDGTLIPGIFDDDDKHQERGLVLTLSSVTDKGPKPLYSGLQASVKANASGALAPLDVKSLPNGMTVIAPGSLHAHRKLKESKEQSAKFSNHTAPSNRWRRLSPREADSATPSWSLSV
jgi:hypothetical protein